MASLINDEGVQVTVPDDTVDSYLADGWRVQGTDAIVPDESWTVADLHDYAGRAGIDLGDAKLKADILAAIDDARG